LSNDAQIILLHDISDDYLDLKPRMIVCRKEKEMTQWCVDCLLKAQLDEKTARIIRQIFPEKCQCHEHQHHCCSQSDTNTDACDTEAGLNQLTALDPTDYQSIIEWLLWVGDDETRNCRIYRLIYEKYANEPELRDYWLHMITLAHLFTVRTPSCHHVLSRPYGHCRCQFHSQIMEQMLTEMKNATLFI